MVLMGYTKLFSEIVMSTVWREKDTTRLVWITMLALRNRHHVVEGSVPGLADCARVSIKACRSALKVLSEPDPDSRSQELDGRRIQEVDGGWFIINGEKYRRKMSEDERREKNAIYQKNHRERKKSVSTKVDISAKSAQTEEETETKKNKKAAFAVPSILNQIVGFPMAWECFKEMRQAKRAKLTDRAAEIILTRLSEKPERAIEALERCIEKNWTSFEWDWIDKSKNGNGFSKPKEKAPCYPKMTESREVSDEEFEKNRRIAHEETARFKEQFK